jgi:hypothetical protein
MDWGIPLLAVGLFAHLLHQAHGRGESLFLWGFIHLALAVPICFIPHRAIAGLLQILLFAGLLLLMRPWTRKSVVVRATREVPAETVAEMVEAVRARHELVDITVQVVESAPENAITLRVYTDQAQQAQLDRDAAALRARGIVPYIRFGPVTTLQVAAGDADLAAIALGLDVPGRWDPSAN